MATRAPVQLAEENNLLAANNLKAGAGKAVPNLLAQGSKRRALGDVSNASNIGARNVNGKENAKVADANIKLRAAPARVKPEISKEPAAAQPASTRTEPTKLVPAPRTRLQLALQAKQTQQGGRSFDELLQDRSQAGNVTLKKEPPSPLPDIDSADKSNPLAAPEYVNDIYSYYKRVEPKFRVPADYMSKQADINEKMRAILVDWLVEVHLKFKLMPETLYLTINLIDRFLDIKQVTRKNLQLVGVTAMLIASKYEEIWAPEVRDFVYISDRAYTKEQILAMEKLMLNTLRFQLTLPTTYNFLARDLKAAGVGFDKDVAMLSSYLVELSMVDYSMLKYNYSTIAAAALYVSMKAHHKHDTYPTALARHAGYSLNDILPCAGALVELMQKATSSNLNAVNKKYSGPKYNEAAKKAVPLEVLDEVAELSL